MLRAIASRLGTAIPSLVGVVIVTFLLTRVLPGDTAAYFAGPAATAEAVEQVRHNLGLDRPLSEQFFGYVKDLARGNLGTSLSTGQPVAGEIAPGMPTPTVPRAPTDASAAVTSCAMVATVAG